VYTMFDKSELVKMTMNWKTIEGYANFSKFQYYSTQVGSRFKL